MQNPIKVISETSNFRIIFVHSLSFFSPNNMNPFLTIYDLDLSQSTLLLCKEPNTSILYSLPGSILFTLPFKASDLVDKIRTLALSDSSKIVCYDKGDLLSSSTVFWCLKAAGFENIFILLGGVYLYHDLGFEVITSELSEAFSDQQVYLPFNNAILSVATEEQKKLSYCQRIRADRPVAVATPRGQLLACEEVREKLKEEGISYKKGKAVQVVGKYATVVGSVLLWMGEEHVSVVVENRESGNFLAHNRSVDAREMKEEDSYVAYSVHDYTYNYEAECPTSVKSVRAKDRKGGSVCGNCRVF
jgi:hypothetical protein